MTVRLGGRVQASIQLLRRFISLASGQTSSSATHFSVLYIDLGWCNAAVIGGRLRETDHSESLARGDPDAPELGGHHRFCSLRGDLVT